MTRWRLQADRNGSGDLHIALRRNSKLIGFTIVKEAEGAELCSEILAGIIAGEVALKSIETDVRIHGASKRTCLVANSDDQALSFIDRDWSYAPAVTKAYDSFLKGRRSL